MAVDKVLRRIERKLDVILEKAGLDPNDFEKVTGKTAARPPRELTPAEQEAIDNAPKYIEATPVGPQAPANPPVQPGSAPSDDEHKDDAPKDPEKDGEEASPPWEGYDDAKSDDVIERLRSLDVDARERALAYERKNKNRVTITRVNWNS